MYLSIDNQEKKYWAWVEGDLKKLKTYTIPRGISLEAGQEKIAFYPDGTIDKLTIKVTGVNKEAVTFTTKGVFRGVKLQAQE